MGYAEVFGRPSTIQGVVSRLSQYPLGQVLDLAGRASAVLHHSEIISLDTQNQLCTALLGSKALIAQRRMLTEALGEKRHGREPAFVLFDEAALIAATKLAAVASPPTASPTNSSLEGFGEALLMLNDLIEATPLNPIKADPATPAGQRKWAYYAFVASLFYQRTNFRHSLARTFHLYLSDNPALHGSGSYIDLPSLVEVATGLKPIELWSALFAFLSNYYSINKDTAHNTNATISRSHFFDVLALDDVHVASMFALVAQDVNTFTAKLAGSAPEDLLAPFASLAIAAAPLVTIGDQCFGPSLPLIMQRLSGGLYHILLNSYPEADRKARSRFQGYLGDVFEDYVHRLLQRAFAPGGTVRYVDEREIASALPKTKGRVPQACDGLLVRDDTVIVLEFKAKFLTAAARAGEDEAAFFNKLEDIVIAPAKQISNTIDMIRSGSLSALGVDHLKLSKVYPVVVHLQEFPVRPPFYNWVSTAIADAGVLSQPGVRALQFLEIGDLEALEPKLASGTRLDVILERKVADSRTRGESLVNYSVLRGQSSLLDGRNSFLDRIYLNLTAQSEQFFADHVTSGADNGLYARRSAQDK